MEFLLPGHPMRLAAPVQVASIAALHARAVRSCKIEMPPADLVVVDEAHHAPAKTYRRILEEYSSADLIGLTATPCRGDGRGLGDAFGTILECPQVAELVAAGHLVGTRTFAPCRPDLAGIHTERGDYVIGELAERMDKQTLVGDIVGTWLKWGEGRRTVVFATSVSHSVHIRNEFRREGVTCEHLDGATPSEERDAILARLAAGTIDVVVNCMVLTEGWDCSEVGCVVLARPTRHIGLYRQMVGRVLRPAPGKVDALVLDHAGAVFEHGFVEEPVIWTLHPDRRAEVPAQLARGRGELPSLKICPECQAVRRQGQPCPCCGWRPQPRPVAVETEEGELGEVDRRGVVTPLPDDPEHFYRELLWIVRAHNYKPGWAAHKHKIRYGVWPPRSWAGLEPVEPSRATLRWVRSENIRFAKSRGAA